MSRSCPTTAFSKSLLIALPWIAAASPAPAQDVLLDIPGVSPHAFAAYAIPIGDWDNDGIDDLAIGAPNDDVGTKLGGAVRIHSGRDGSVLSTRIMRRLGARFGYPLARMPDLNGDGIDDLAVAAPEYDKGGPSDGSVFLYAGGTFRFLSRIDPTDGACFFVAPMGDVDGDGVCDVATSDGGAPGTVYVHSCADGHEITHFDGAYGEAFGMTLSVLDDVDGDGVQDLVVGAPFFENASHQVIGAAFVISTATGTVLRTHAGTFAAEYLGVGSTTLADLDGDGVREYAVIAANDGAGNGGMFFVYSGATGAQLANVLSPSADENLRDRLFDAGDVNGDGFRDVVVLGTWLDPKKTWHGAAFVFSGKTWLELARVQTEETSLFLGPSLDLGGDGLSDLVIGTLEPSLDGRVRVFSGDDLFLVPSPPVVTAGATLDLATAEGVPNGLTLLTLEAVDGTATFQLIDGLGVLDNVGHRVVSKTVPHGLGGHTMTFRSYAKDAAGRVIRSAAEEVKF